jgi:prepilin-type N-terminal cleavage/methylation domain-containing protein
MMTTKISISVNPRAPGMAKGRSASRRGHARAGFTLLEVMLALVLTGLVVLVAYAAAQVSFEARARLTSTLHEDDRLRAIRVLLRDALRNARAPQRASAPGFTLANGRLSFVASGGAAPLDPDYDWLITAQAGAQGLEVDAVPLGHARSARITFRAPSVTRWQVHVLALDDSAWQDDWSAPTVLPRAASLVFWQGTTPVGQPMDVVLWSGNPPASVDTQP